MPSIRDEIKKEMLELGKEFNNLPNSELCEFVINRALHRMKDKQEIYKQNNIGFNDFLDDVIYIMNVLRIELEVDEDKLSAVMGG